MGKHKTSRSFEDTLQHGQRCNRKESSLLQSVCCSAHHQHVGKRLSGRVKDKQCGSCLNFLKLSFASPAGYTIETMVLRDVLAQRTIALALTLSLFGDILCGRRIVLAKIQSPFHIQYASAAGAAESVVLLHPMWIPLAPSKLVLRQPRAGRRRHA